MLSSIMALALAFLLLDFAVFVNAGIFVFNPLQGATCHGGEPCTVEWVEDGSAPLLSAVGVTTVGLYTGKQQLVQSIQAVDVSQSHSLTFTPNPAAGPNSANYYLSFQSTNLKVNGIAYGAYSAFFKLDQMTGSFDSPLASATSSIPIPSSLIHATSASTAVNKPITTTITVGTPSSTSLDATSTATAKTTVSSSSAASSSTRVSASSSSSSSALSSSASISTSASSSSRFITSTTIPSASSFTTTASGTAVPAATSTTSQSSAASGRTIPTALLLFASSFALPLIFS